jgi:hypothetical protein
MFLICFSIVTIHGQETIPVTGGYNLGTGGSVSYTVGQIAYLTFSGTNGSVAQGAQQPYEISVVTAIENTESIALEYKIYPNPTEGKIILIVKPFNEENLRYILYDLNGILLQEKTIECEETEISMENLSPAIYILKTLKDCNEIKVFKIVKK